MNGVNLRVESNASRWSSEMTGWHRDQWVHRTHAFRSLVSHLKSILPTFEPRFVPIDHRSTGGRKTTPVRSCSAACPSL
jgi:hypothetical protein